MSQSTVPQIEQELKPGETLLWTGRSLNRKGAPRKGWGQPDAALIGGFLGGFAGVWISLALDISLPMLPLVLIPIVAVIGFAKASTSRSRSAHLLSCSMFALTNLRILVVRDCFRDRRVKSMPLEYIRTIHVIERTEGRGNLSIIAGPAPGPAPVEVPTPASAASAIGRRAMRPMWSEPLPFLRFVLISDAASVRDQIEAARKARLNSCQ